MSLQRYTNKRHFEKTPEPDPQQKYRKQSRKPVFVIQLHQARARHYDFRLEVDGVLKSWAVPKGPSLRTGEKRLAVEVEDHPLAYASFEGEIPQGNYGAGHVDIFDHGTWTTHENPQAAINAGNLDFELSGNKLKGAWKLIRTRMKGKQQQWLLIKREDEFSSNIEADDLLQPSTRAKKIKS